MAYGRQVFVAKLQSSLQQCLMYEDPVCQDAARRTITLDELEEKTLVALAREGKFDVSKDEFEHARLKQLLLWFKESFRWVNQPTCESCGGESVAIGEGRPNAEESKWQAGRVELYRCRACSREVRFPRYNHPRKLLETRRGRCGEWANCFTLYCRALGYRARLILDFTDHVWTECYSTLHGRWVHADPCEGVMDRPLLYEQGWGKKLSYAIALAHNGVRDVTKRYTKKWPEVQTRRNITSEEEVAEVLMLLNMQMRADLPSSEWDELAILDAQEEDEISKSYQEGTPSESPLRGRQSGSEEWRVARGEIGTFQQSSSVKKACPVRLCVDEHVKLIRQALGCLWSDIVESENSVQKVVLGLKALHAFLMKLKSQPFRDRGLKLDSQAEGAWLAYASDETTTFLLGALGLQWSLHDDGEFWVSADENPVRAALALPVALQLLERLTKELPSEITVKWLVHGSRLCKGVTCTSGEQPDSEVSSSAFDGLVSTKWLEPNGGKGAWIVYHLLDGDSQQLAAYELTSANDCPARDPCDWVLEGSSDNGKTWRNLDSQYGQSFERRFLSKTYEIAQGNNISCDSFRLWISSTRDPKEDGRLQIACIDFITFKV